MNVLLISEDENAAIAGLAAELLPGARIRTYAGPAAEQAVGAAGGAGIALLTLPHSGGERMTALASALRAAAPRLNLILCAGDASFAMRAWELDCSAYLPLPLSADRLRHALENLRYPLPEEQRVSFRCFGNFEAFCDGTPIRFKYSRTRELLAYLVDRNGAGCSLKELTSVLFEDDPHRSYMYQIRLDLIRTLEALGAADILNQSRGSLGIRREKVRCDYYDYLDRHVPPPVREYMTQYSFSEQTFADLFMNGRYAESGEF